MFRLTLILPVFPVTNSDRHVEMRSSPGTVFLCAGAYCPGEDDSDTLPRAMMMINAQGLSQFYRWMKTGGGTLPYITNRTKNYWNTGPTHPLLSTGPATPMTAKMKRSDQTTKPEKQADLSKCCDRSIDVKVNHEGCPGAEIMNHNEID